MEINIYKTSKKEEKKEKKKNKGKKRPLGDLSQTFVVGCAQGRCGALHEPGGNAALKDDEIA